MSATEADNTGHVDVKCTNDYCVGCVFCTGGLSACTVCGGAESSMPSTCPGELMDEETSNAVQAQRRDFRGGKWIDTPRNAL